MAGRVPPFQGSAVHCACLYTLSRAETEGNGNEEQGEGRIDSSAPSFRRLLVFRSCWRALGLHPKDARPSKVTSEAVSAAVRRGAAHRPASGWRRPWTSQQSAMLCVWSQASTSGCLRLYLTHIFFLTPFSETVREPQRPCPAHLQTYLGRRRPWP